MLNRNGYHFLCPNNFLCDLFSHLYIFKNVLNSYNDENYYFF